MILERKERLEVNLCEVSEVTQLEVGWYYQVTSINRANGKLTLQMAKAAWLKPSFWGKLRGKKPLEVVFT